MTTFPDGLFQYGGAPVGLPYFPALRKGAKVFFVDPAIGSDTASGLKPEAALDTVAAAFAKTTDKAGDIVILLGDGSTTGTARDEAIVWDHSNTHLIGVTAPGLNKRARIAPPSTATDVDAYTPYITLSGSGCIFANFSLFQGNSEDSKASVGILLSGSQNYLYGVDILNGAHANQGDEVCYNLTITGSENVIERCFIGTDSYSRGNNAASANINFGGARNVVKDCILSMYADDTEPVFVYAAASCGDRWHLMERCVCVNTSPVLTAATTIDAGVSWSNTAGCMLLLKDTGFYGCTDVTAADATKVVVFAPTPGTPVDAGLFKGVDVA
jgi:hypothetical protein